MFVLLTIIIFCRAGSKDHTETIEIEEGIKCADNKTRDSSISLERELSNAFSWEFSASLSSEFVASNSVEFGNISAKSETKISAELQMSTKIKNEMKESFSSELSSSFCSSTEVYATKKRSVIYTAPAGKNYRVLQAECKFKDLLEKEKISFRSPQIKIEETSGEFGDDKK